MTSVPDPLAQLRQTLADAHVLLAAHRAQLDKLKRRLDDAGINEGSDLVARFDKLAQTVADALDAASPAGPASPNWDQLKGADRAAALGLLRKWVHRVLIPGYVVRGAFTLADCWERHEQALWELGALHTQWRKIYERPKPPAGLALEWNDRWVPGVMRRIDDATGGCNMGHTG